MMERSAPGPRRVRADAMARAADDPGRGRSGDRRRRPSSDRSRFRGSMPTWCASPTIASSSTAGQRAGSSSRSLAVGSTRSPTSCSVPAIRLAWPGCWHTASRCRRCSMAPCSRMAPPAEIQVYDTHVTIVPADGDPWQIPLGALTAIERQAEPPGVVFQARNGQRTTVGRLGRKRDEFHRAVTEQRDAQGELLAAFTGSSAFADGLGVARGQVADFDAMVKRWSAPARAAGAAALIDLARGAEPRLGLAQLLDPDSDSMEAAVALPVHWASFLLVPIGSLTAARDPGRAQRRHLRIRCANRRGEPGPAGPALPPPCAGTPGKRRRTHAAESLTSRAPETRATDPAPPRDSGTDHS